MAVLKAEHCNRTYIAKDEDMNADFETDIIDFINMKVGSVQAIWKNNDALDGQLIVEASNIMEDPESFDEIEGGVYTMNDDGTRTKRRTKLFNLGQLGYRYVRVLYLKGTNTQGKITIVALGKK